MISYYHKNILKTSALLWATKSCYGILKFILSKISVENNINKQQAFTLLF